MALLAAVVIVDFLVVAIGLTIANDGSVRDAGRALVALLWLLAAIGLTGSGLFWWLGRSLSAMPRSLGTAAFLLAQGAIWAFMAFMALMGSNR
ncbi:hypothetical protein EER27_16630 [Lysobacter psychrotolerans]|uniref:Uncharacterized protein n=2 Tax=Montanilutibacter psychrotolerans TaxID=1327343 RepID=A0A3M8SKM2_9GAMM|nr:hypothetical protein EER27_16630 [Lysobacter psychrotolerans]